MTERRTFVIGDVHGHVDRLRALLLKAGVIDENDQRQGPNAEAEVVQLGDLGHFGSYRQADDMLDYITYYMAKQWIDVVLWGNHEAALFDSQHVFRGYRAPSSITRRLVKNTIQHFACARHGYLLTHAGLNAEFGEPANLAGAFSAESIAAFLNAHSHDLVIDAIGPLRGGFSSLGGGVLWRDDRESLWRGVPQIYGHTRGDIRRYGDSWCIDVAGKDDDNLAGIWLPDLTVVAVGVDAEIFETQAKGEAA